MSVTTRLWRSASRTSATSSSRPTKVVICSGRLVGKVSSDRKRREVAAEGGMHDLEDMLGLTQVA